MRIKLALLMGSFVAVVAVLAAGCGFLGLNGDPRDNIRPEVFITNYPPSSESNLEVFIDTTWNPDTTIQSIDTFPPWQAVLDTIIYLANPRIYWYGTDVDGRVDAFEYAVLPTDSLVAHPAGMPSGVLLCLANELE